MYLKNIFFIFAWSSLLLSCGGESYQDSYGQSAYLGSDRFVDIVWQQNSSPSQNENQEVKHSKLWDKEFGFGNRLERDRESKESFIYWPQPGGKSLPYNAKADRLVVFKSKRQLFVIEDNKPIKGYAIALGFSPEGKKKWQGDGRTPEGQYYITHKNPQSKFHLSLGISYPNIEDFEYAQKLGVDPGGDIMIHGMPNNDSRNVQDFHPNWDWTSGCLAVTDAEIEELWRVVPVGTPIEIKP